MLEGNTSSRRIRILTVDDHAVVRKGLVMLLATENDMELVAEAENGIEAVRLARIYKPDVILMDLVMPQRDGIGAIQDIIKENPQARILILSSFAEDENIIAGVKAGAMGYLLKDSSPQELLEAIREISQGKSSVSPIVATRLITKIKQEYPKQKTQTRQMLTDREIEVLGLVAEGLSNQAIAQRMCLSKATVRFHISNILDKLDLSNRTQAGLYAIRTGIGTGKKHS